MEEIICFILSFLVIILFKLIFKIDIKKAKGLEQNKDMQKITDKFPENINIAKEMLKMLNNKNVTIEEAQNTKTSLYIVVTNKILIADLKDNYGRIQTIAHECIHSVQEKTLLMFNFIFSNFFMLYFIIASILTICRVLKNSMLQIYILLLSGLIQFVVRSYLEIEAMIKSKYLAKEYMEKKEICSKDEINKLMIQYDKINNMGIPFTLYTLLINIFIKIMVFAVVAYIF